MAQAVAALALDRDLRRYLDPVAFYTWLIRRKPDDDVGVALRCGACPLSVYLSECIGHEVLVDGEYVYNDDTRVELPRWAIAFVHAIDDMGIDVQVPAREAARRLRYILAELGHAPAQS